MRPLGGGRFPADQREFGERLRALRGRRGLRLVAARAYVSAAQLSRYERGEILPGLDKAEALDHAYEADGWVVLSLRGLWRPRWQPWKDEWPSRHHAGAWPAAYNGLVWIKLMTATEEPVSVVVDVEWGPWGREFSVDLPGDGRGVVLTTFKAADADGISRTLNLTTSVPVYALFGADDGLAGEQVLDVRRGWVRRDDGASDDELDHGPLRD